MVHMAFRASNVDVLNLMQRCLRIRTVQVPYSYHKTMSNAIEVFWKCRVLSCWKETYGATERTWMSTTLLRMQPLMRFVPGSHRSDC